MPHQDRLKIARFAVDSIAPFVRASGQRHLPGPNMSGHWLLVWQDLQFILTEQVLLWPEDASLSSVIDVWDIHRHKVLSVRWQPSRPWLPPTVVNFKAGDWVAVVERLGACDRIGAQPFKL